MTISWRSAEPRRRAAGWEAYCDLFAADAVYVEHFVGTFHGRDEIKAWLIPAMSTWSQIRYPLRWRMFDDEAGLVAFAVGNEMPDVDGSGPVPPDALLLRNWL